MEEWSLQNAQNRFNELINAALAGEPQRVTLKGQAAVIVMAAAKYDLIKKLDEPNIPTFGELLLEIPQDDQEFQRLTIVSRHTDL